MFKKSCLKWVVVMLSFSHLPQGFCGDSSSNPVASEVTSPMENENQPAESQSISEQEDKLQPNSAPLMNKPLQFIGLLEALFMSSNGHPTAIEQEKLAEETRRIGKPGLTFKQVNGWFRGRRRTKPKSSSKKPNSERPASKVFECACASGIKLRQRKAIERHMANCRVYQAKIISLEDASSSSATSSLPSSSSISSNSSTSSSSLSSSQVKEPQKRKSSKKKETGDAESSTLSSSNPDSRPKKKARASTKELDKKKPSESFKCSNCGRKLQQSAFAYHKIVCVSANGSEGAPESPSISSKSPVSDFDLSDLGYNPPPLVTVLSDLLSDAPMTTDATPSIVLSKSDFLQLASNVPSPSIPSSAVAVSSSTSSVPLSPVVRNAESEDEFGEDLDFEAPTLEDLVGTNLQVLTDVAPATGMSENNDGCETESDRDLGEEQDLQDRVDKSPALSGSKSLIAQNNKNVQNEDDSEQLVLVYELDDPEEAPTESPSGALSQTEVVQSIEQPPMLISSQSISVIPPQVAISSPASAMSSSTLSSPTASSSTLSSSTSNSSASSVAQDDVKVKKEFDLDAEVMDLISNSNFSTLAQTGIQAIAQPHPSLAISSQSMPSQSESQFLINMLNLCTARVKELTSSLTANPAGCAETINELERVNRLQSRLTHQLKNAIKP